MTLPTCTQCQTPISEGSRFCRKCHLPFVSVAGKYKLKRQLSQGGIGVLYLAEHEGLSLDRERVVKIIRPEHIKEDTMKRRMMQEIEVTSLLSRESPHIVQVYDDFGEEPGLGFYYIMEFLRGRTLREQLHHHGPLSLLDALHVFAQMCEALEHAHEKGIVHRDLKPENIFLIERRNDPFYVKVIDFGITRLLAAKDQTRLTQGAIGTPAYMAPEQWDKGEADQRTDIYALGLILYEMLSGKLPYVVDEASVMGYAFAHLSREPLPFSAVCPDLSIPPAIEAAIFQSLSKTSEPRPSSCRDFWNLIAPFAQGEDPFAPPMSSGAIRTPSASSLARFSSPRPSPSPSLLLATGSDVPPPLPAPSASKSRFLSFAFLLLFLLALGSAAAYFLLDPPTPSSSASSPPSSASSPSSPPSGSPSEPRLTASNSDHLSSLSEPRPQPSVLPSQADGPKAQKNPTPPQRTHTKKAKKAKRPPKAPTPPPKALALLPSERTPAADRATPAKRPPPPVEAPPRPNPSDPPTPREGKPSAFDRFQQKLADTNEELHKQAKALFRPLTQQDTPSTPSKKAPPPRDFPDEEPTTPRRTSPLSSLEQEIHFRARFRERHFRHSTRLRRLYVQFLQNPHDAALRSRIVTLSRSYPSYHQGLEQLVKAAPPSFQPCQQLGRLLFYNAFRPFLRWFREHDPDLGRLALHTKIQQAGGRPYYLQYYKLCTGFDPPFSGSQNR